MTSTEIEDRIYKLYSPATQTKILIAGGMIAVLMPFTDTVYLPALDSLAENLNTSATLVALTISIYLGAVGVGQIVWGPLSDYYGRKNLLLINLVIYEAITIGCIFSNNITTLIILRTFQGFMCGNTVVAVQAIIAGVFEPEKRGTAMGAFLAPLLLGPIIAPLVGGALSQAFSWRATFVLLAIMTVPIAIAAYSLLPWETHHWWAQHRVTEQDMIPPASPANEVVATSDPAMDSSLAGDSAAQSDVEKGKNPYNEVAFATSTAAPPLRHQNEKSLMNQEQEQKQKQEQTQMDDIDLEAGGEESKKQEPLMTPAVISDNDSNRDMISDRDLNTAEGEEGVVEAEGIYPPELVNPLFLLRFLLEWELAATYWFAGTTFAAMFTSLTLLPLYLAKPPYSLSPSIVGVCFLPVGIAMFAGAVSGGILSDWAAVKYPASIDGRMYPNLLLTWLVPIGCIGFGYSVDKGANLGAVLIAQSVLGYGQAVAMPAVFNYLTAARADNAGAVGAVNLFLNFALSAIVVSISVPIADAIGFANFFWILTGVTVGTLTWATWACKRNMHLGKMNPELKELRRSNSRKSRPSENMSSKSNKSGKFSEKSGKFSAVGGVSAKSDDRSFSNLVQV